MRLHAANAVCVREKLQFCLSVAGISNQDDPYWDPVELERLIGTGELYLNPLSMQLENAGQIKLFDSEARPCGQVSRRWTGGKRSSREHRSDEKPIGN